MRTLDMRLAAASALYTKNAAESRMSSEAGR
jgi:hypothetical protein